MIQRIQSLWLLLAASATAATFFLPVYRATTQAGVQQNLLVGSNFLLMLVGAFLVVVPLVAIFFFKKRSQQKQFIWLSLLVQLVFIVLIWTEATRFTTGQEFKQESYFFGAIMPVVSIVFLVLAYRGIRHDEKLLKEMDRLR
jgi:CDP-diglyceride synthetase